MKKYIILGTLLFGMYPLSAFNPTKAIHQLAHSMIQDEVTAIITASTTEKELEDLVVFFKEHDLELYITKQERNETSEITGLRINLQRGYQKRQYAMFSNLPIPDLELGSKDQVLFIQSKGTDGIAGNWANPLSGNDPQGAISNFMQHGFNFNFGKNMDSIFFNGHAFDLNKLRDQMMQSFRFGFGEGEEENWDLFGSNQNPNISSSKRLPKYSFIDQPNINKLIIINRKESTFESLNKLAKADQLEVVDFLKPNTAISIYGNKAKDGAIIATTK